MVLWGAGKLTDGATSLAARMNIPPIVIGLTVVAMGTSMPEFFISFISALKGTTDLAVGNVVGSNIFNALLIVGWYVCYFVVGQMAGNKSWGTVEFHPQWPAVLPAIALILYLLARRAIRADEKLVRSLDRIR